MPGAAVHPDPCPLCHGLGAFISHSVVERLRWRLVCAGCDGTGQDIRGLLAELGIDPEERPE